MLHTVNKSPFDKNSLDTCLRLAQKGSAILLIEDGVYGAMQNTSYTAKLEAAMGDFEIYALGPDVQARGIEAKIMDGVKLVGYDGFVDLAAEHDKVESWL